MKIFQIRTYPPYRLPLRCAVGCQLLGILITSTILDSGEFRWIYLIFSELFWIIIGMLAMTRANPTRFERMGITWGPLIIIMLPLFLPW